jgi:hypothetical protein
MTHSTLNRTLFILLAFAANLGAPAVTSTDTPASFDAVANPLWLLVVAGALLFVMAEAPEREHAP